MAHQTFGSLPFAKERRQYEIQRLYGVPFGKVTHEMCFVSFFEKGVEVFGVESEGFTQFAHHASLKEKHLQLTAWHIKQSLHCWFLNVLR